MLIISVYSGNRIFNPFCNIHSMISDTLKVFGCHKKIQPLSLIHISEPTRPRLISYAVFCLKKFFFNDTATTEIYTV